MSEFKTRKFDVALAVKEQKAGQQPNWYVAHIKVETDASNKFPASIAISKLEETYEDQTDAELLDVQALELVEITQQEAND